jgi:hypothetical protein
MTTWKELLKEAFETTGDDFSKIVHTMSDEEINKEFNDDGYGDPEGCSFTAWGEKYVYFPLCYDGAEFVGCAARNPCKEETSHLGGW